MSQLHTFSCIKQLEKFSQRNVARTFVEIKIPTFSRGLESPATRFNFIQGALQLTQRGQKKIGKDGEKK